MNFGAVNVATVAISRNCPGKTSYDWCKEQMYYEQDETYSDWPVGNRMIYKEQDPAPWGADEVYRLYSEEGWWAYTYLLCYEDQIIEIRFDWEPTTDDMAIVNQKLNP